MYVNIKSINKSLFQFFMKITHWLTRDETRRTVAKPVMRSLANLTLLTKSGGKKQQFREVANEWQRMFPSRKAVPITAIENMTVFAEIRTPCPYRGSGNVDGCYRMMEYDRRILETLGADFVVLKSQAEPDVDVCRVAITRERTTRIDLLPAHLRIRAASRSSFGTTLSKEVE